jgi:hypothetical protein
MTDTIPPIITAIEDVAATVANPSPENILADAEFALKLVKQLKTSLNGSHPSVLKLVKALLKELL